MTLGISMTRDSIIYLIAVVTVVFAFAIVATYLPSNTKSSDINISHVEAAKLNSFEARSREASVKIMTPSGGHGTGTLFEYKGRVFIFTAKHVTEGFSRFLIISNSGEIKEASLIYSDLVADFAVLSADEFDSIKPVKFKVKDYNSKALIDLDVIFSGYPSVHSLLTSRGRVAGFEVNSIIIHSVAWGGSSGSSIFSSKGDFLGILFGTSVDAPFGIPTIIDNIIWASPYYVIDWNALDRKIQENGE